MKLRLVPIDSLIPDPENARTHSDRNLNTIADSLREFGQRRPIVVTPTNLILAGNGTYEAARRLGWTQIAVVGVPGNWTAEQAKAYALADNRTAELAKWDGPVLAAQLEHLESVGFSPAVLGFKIAESPEPQQRPTQEIDLDGFDFEHTCPDCGFEFNA